MKHTETHPEYVEGCFGCKLTSLTFYVPGYMSAKVRSERHGMSGIDEAAAIKADIHEALKNDTEGRFERA